MEEPSRSKIIWLVDNEVLYTRLISKILVEHGYEIHTLSSGEACLEKLKLELPDLLLLDSSMPGMDGFQVCKQVRKNPKFENLKIIMLSASVEVVDFLQAFASGADDLIKKPIERSHFIDVIKMHFDEMDRNDVQGGTKRHRSIIHKAYQLTKENGISLSKWQQTHEQLCGLLNAMTKHLNCVACVLNKQGVILYTFGSLTACFQCAPRDVLYQNFLSLRNDLSPFFYQALYGERVSHVESMDGYLTLSKLAHHFFPLQREETIIYIAMDEYEKKYLQQELEQMHFFGNVGRLTTHLTHDFRNLLQVIQGYTEIMSLNGNVDEDKLYLDYIQQAAHHGDFLTRQILNQFSSVSEEEEQVNDLNQSIIEIKNFSEYVLGKSIFLNVNLSKQSCWVTIQKVKLTQILMNLILNARDSIEREGQISIATLIVLGNEIENKLMAIQDQKNYVVLTIEDNGAGIDQKHLPHIFTPFYSNHNYLSGAGIGLTSIHRLVTENKGSIFCTSELNQGTRFTIYFPLAVGKTKAQQAMNDTHFNVMTPRTETLLLVEDDRRVNSLLKHALEQQGFEVHAARSATEALAWLQDFEKPIAIALIDLALPDMNGFELATEIRRMSNMRVLFMSASPEDTKEKKFKLPPHEHFICKPFHLRDLMSKLEILLCDSEGTQEYHDSE